MRAGETPPLPWAGDPLRTCPHCGCEEPSEQLLETNHAPRKDSAEEEGVCEAMHQTRHHVLDAVQGVLDARSAIATAQLTGQSMRCPARKIATAEAALRAAVMAARNVWPDPVWLSAVMTNPGQR